MAVRPSPAGARPRARAWLLRRLPAAALAAGLAAALAGCEGERSPQEPGQARELRGAVVLAMGVPSDETIDTELSEALKERLKEILREFHLLHPRAQVQLQLYREERLLAEVRLRTAAGTAPDLLFVNNSTATALQDAGLSRTVRLPEGLLQTMDPAEVRRFQTPSGAMTSLPVLLLPQLACFDRRRLGTPPADLTGLLRLAGQGVRVGLPLDGFNLAWTFGSLGAAPAVEELSAGQSPTPARREALGRWLTWLKQANQLPEVRFQISQSALIQELGKGQLDWTSCRSTNLARLRDELGDNLGVATLPRGPGGPPSPLSRQRVLAFGRNSSDDQRQVAESFARFVLTPLTQRNLALQRQEVLPVLGSLRLPEGRKGTLQLLSMAQAQARSSHGGSQAIFRQGDLEGVALGRVVSDWLFGDLDKDGAIAALVQAIQPAGGRR